MKNEKCNNNIIKVKTVASVIRGIIGILSIAFGALMINDFCYIKRCYSDR